MGFSTVSFHMWTDALRGLSASGLYFGALDPDSAQHISALVVFLQGVISFFSPCILPVIPLYLAYVTGDLPGDTQKNRRVCADSVMRTVCFVIGISTAFFCLGFAATVVGRFLTRWRVLFMIIGGVLMFFFGLYRLGLFGTLRAFQTERRMIFFPSAADGCNTGSGEKRGRRGRFFGKGKWAAAFFLGFTFSFAWTPCVGPILTSVLLLAGSSAAAGSAFFLIALYTIGFLIPFVVVSIFASTLLNVIRAKKQRLVWMSGLGGILLIVMAVIMWSGAWSAYSSDRMVGQKSVHESGSEKVSEDVSEDTASNEKSDRRQAPDFELQDQFGNVHRLSDYKGKTVFLNFWATWCPPCREEMPFINELYGEFGKNGQDVIILGMAGPGQGREGDVSYIRSFLEENGYEFPVLMDMDGSLFSAYGIRAFPTTYMITANGDVYGKTEGGLMKVMMKQLIEQTRDEGKAGGS